MMNTLLRSTKSSARLCKQRIGLHACLSMDAGVKSSDLYNNDNDTADASDKEDLDNSALTLTPPVFTSSSSLVPLATERPRNKLLAQILRLGLNDLNQSALDISNNSLSRRSLFEAKLQDPAKEARLTAKSEQMLRFAQETVTHLNRTKGLLQWRGQPIHLVEAKLTSLRHVKIFWCLPMSLILNTDISKLDKQYYEFKVHQQITEQGGLQEFRKHMFALMRQAYGFPPSVALEHVSDRQLLRLLDEVTGINEMEQQVPLLQGPPKMLGAGGGNHSGIEMGEGEQGGDSVR